MTRKQFEKLDEQEQWNWVVANAKQINSIALDNDTTYVMSDCFKEKGNDECNGSITMKSFLGNGWGIDHLLEALGIKSEGV